MEAELKNGACPEYEALLEDHLMGDLGGNDAKKLSNHLKTCAGCKAALDAATASARLLRLAEPTPDPGPGFAHVIMARIRLERENLAAQRSLWRPIVSMAWPFAMSATLALAVLIAFAATWQQPRQPNLVSAVQKSEARDLFPDPGALPSNRDEILMMVADTNHGKQ
jgi:hypothetical protein